MRQRGAGARAIQGNFGFVFKAGSNPVQKPPSTQKAQPPQEPFNGYTVDGFAFTKKRSPSVAVPRIKQHESNVLIETKVEAAEAIPAADDEVDLKAVLSERPIRKAPKKRKALFTKKKPATKRTKENREAIREVVEDEHKAEEVDTVQDNAEDDDELSFDKATIARPPAPVSKKRKAPSRVSKSEAYQAEAPAASQLAPQRLPSKRARAEASKENDSPEEADQADCRTIVHANPVPEDSQRVAKEKAKAKPRVKAKTEAESSNLFSVQHGSRASSKKEVTTEDEKQAQILSQPQVTAEINVQKITEKSTKKTRKRRLSAFEEAPELAMAARNDTHSNKPTAQTRNAGSREIDSNCESSTITTTSKPRRTKKIVVDTPLQETPESSPNEAVARTEIAAEDPPKRKGRGKKVAPKPEVNEIPPTVEVAAVMPTSPQPPREAHKQNILHQSSTVARKDEARMNDSGTIRNRKPLAEQDANLASPRKSDATTVDTDVEGIKEKSKPEPLSKQMSEKAPLQKKKATTLTKTTTRARGKKAVPETKLACDDDLKHVTQPAEAAHVPPKKPTKAGKGVAENHTSTKEPRGSDVDVDAALFAPMTVTSSFRGKSTTALTTTAKHSTTTALSSDIKRFAALPREDDDEGLSQVFDGIAAIAAANSNQESRGVATRLTRLRR
ncbi:hypothetical protein AAFC00_002422 [Neodothiora populina]